MGVLITLTWGFSVSFVAWGTQRGGAFFGAKVES